MIELNHISKSYGATRALDDVSLSIGDVYKRQTL